MKKLYLLELLFILSIISNAQSWSRTLTTDDLYTTTIDPQVIFGGDPIIANSFEIKQDAIDINRTNGNSIYPEGTVFTMYTVNPYSFGYEAQPIEAKNSVWFKAIDKAGNVLTSKALKIPTIFPYGAKPTLAHPFLNNLRDLLTINSLRYDDNDLIVFSGFIEGTEEVNHSRHMIYRTFMVGTYNLVTEDVELEYIDNKTKRICDANDVCTTYHVNSIGVGLDYLEPYNLYQAIGLTANYVDDDLELKNPIAFVFRIDQSGHISVNQKEAFDFSYQPTDVDHNGTGDITVTTGVYQSDQTIHTSCSSYSTDLGLGVFNFKYVPTTNSSNIGEFTNIYSSDFSSNRFFNFLIGTPVVFRDNAGETYVSCDGITTSILPNYAIVGKLNRGLSHSEFYRLEVEPSLGVRVNTGQLTEKDRHVELSMMIEDMSKFNQDNERSIGLIKLQKGNMGQHSVAVKQLYTNDDEKNNIREITSVTAAGVWETGNIFDYYFADGYFQQTDKTRAHVYGVDLLDFDGLCQEDWTAEVAAICYEEEHYLNNLALLDQMNDSKYDVGTTSNYRNVIVEDVSGRQYNCFEFQDQIGDFRIKAKQENTNPYQSELMAYPNPSNGIFNLIIDEARYTTMEVTDAFGKVILIKEFTASDSKKFELDLSHHVSGVYFLNLKNKELNRTIKLNKL